jgi:chromosome partitioning protein
MSPIGRPNFFHDSCVSCRCHPGRAGDSLGVVAPYVGQRNDHQDALGAGLGVTEFARVGRVSDEVRELCRCVLKKRVEGSLDHEPQAKKAAC